MSKTGKWPAVSKRGKKTVTAVLSGMSFPFVERKAPLGRGVLFLVAPAHQNDLHSQSFEGNLGLSITIQLGKLSEFCPERKGSIIDNDAS